MWLHSSNWYKMRKNSVSKRGLSGSSCGEMLNPTSQTLPKFLTRKMHIQCLLAVSLAHFSSVSYSQPIVPTFWGTFNCSMIPEFTLYDKNTHSGVKYNTLYGLQDMEPSVPDVTIIGLYFADSEDGWANAKKQEILGKDLAAKGITVKNVALNFYAPLACVLEGECINYWWSSPSFYPSYDNCAGYVAGCGPEDSRLIESNWLAPLSAVTAIPIFQDTTMGWIWDEFGGQQGDLFIYGKDSKLFAYLCNIKNIGAACKIELVGGGLNDPISYATALKTATAAAKSSSSRCANVAKMEDDYYYSQNEQEIYYVGDEYYSDNNVASQSISVVRRHHDHKVIHKIPTFVYAAAMSLLASLVTCCVYYVRWKRSNSRNMLSGGLAQFTQLPTEDDDSVFENTAVSGEILNPFRNDGLRTDRYGSL